MFIRFAYAGLLAFVLLNMYTAWIVPHIIPRIGSQGFLHGIWNPSAVPGKELANFASAYFYAFVAIQLTVIILLTPPYVAGAIAEERERSTLEALFVTHLRNDQIVLSMLFSRLARLAMILLVGIPILSFLQLLGGIDPNLVFAAFVATGMTALSIASLGLLLSIYAGKRRKAIIQTEVLVIGYLFVTTVVEVALTSPLIVGPGSILRQPFIADYPLMDILGWPAIGNPAIASYRLVDKLWTGAPFVKLLQGFLTDYVLFHGAIAAICIAWAILRLRAVALRDPRSALEQEVRKRRLSPLARWWRRNSFESPLLWKGLVADARSRQGPFTWLFRGCGVALLSWPLLHFFYSFGRFRAVSHDDHLGWLLNDWCRIASAVLGSAMLLAVALRASGSISGERARQTLDSLLATPLRNRTIIFHKWLSSILAPTGWTRTLAIVWAICWAMGALHPVAIPAYLLAWLIDAAFLAAIGVWLSAVSPSTRRALLATMGLALTVLVVLSIAATYLIYKGHNDLELFTLEPPVTFALLAFSPADYHDFLAVGLTSWPRIILVEQTLMAVAAGIFLVLAKLDFRRVTGRREGSAPVANITPALIGSTDLNAPEYVERARTNWPRLVLRGMLLLLPLSLLAGWYVIRGAEGEAKLTSMLAYLDRTDPGWRLEDIDAARRVVPDEENSAPRVREAARDLWRYSTRQIQWDKHFAGHPAERQLSGEQVAMLHDLPKRGSESLVLARSLSGMPYGRFPVNFSPDGVSTNLSHCDAVRLLFWSLALYVFDQSQAQDADGAIRSCQAMVNAGRSIGDEPASISQLVRMAARTATTVCIERILAQGQPSTAALERLQHLLELDEPDPLLLTAMRGERAGFDRLVESLRRGDSVADLLQSGRSRPGRKADQWSDDAIVPVLGGSMKAQRAALLDYYTQAVQAARLPTELQKAQFALIPLPSRFDQPFVCYLIPALNRLADIHLRALAEERCCIVALAAERYRRATGHWPEHLADLVPVYLLKVPADPFTGKPLILRPTAEGIVIYSVGVDGVDDGGKIDRNTSNPSAAGIDLGIRLWNVDKRRQPYTPTKQ
jgi:ABC-type transport system involved in multi-copper enzyme maturation permease subunit